ncbi:MAG: PepSY-associated TM helix domain-containing protein [Verrucomicrobia bacterium]|nr:PepSY-associated TM helix domain-containing protein [Verrucomicrobiota bacterium]
MNNTNLIFRRVHLYLGMLLIPWVIIFALSTFIFNHRDLFHGQFNQPDSWTQLWKKEYKADVPRQQPKLREWARGVLDGNGIKGGFNVRQNRQSVLINLIQFRNPIRVTYQKNEGQLVAEQKRTTVAELMARMHVRHGYGRGGVLYTGWAFVVDLLCFAIIAWIVTGLYLWWKLPATRKPGWVAILSGLATFILLVLTI